MTQFSDLIDMYGRMNDVLKNSRPGSPEWQDYFTNDNISKAIDQTASIYKKIDEVKQRMPKTKKEPAFNMTRTDVEALFDYIQRKKDAPLDQLLAEYTQDDS